MQVPKRKAEERRQFGHPSEDAYLTPEAVRRLEEELARLERQDRPKAAEEVARTREMGDLSENAAYSDAKARLQRLNTRILSIKERLKRAVVIRPEEDPSGRILVGSTVTLDSGGARRTYRIVGSQEANPALGRISRLSPLGSLLLGRKAGETVTLKVDAKETTYAIVEVK